MITDAQKGGISLLDSYSNIWATYSKAVKQIDSLCMYVNKVIEKLRDEHLPGRTAIVMINGERMEVRLKPVGALGYHIWKKAVLYYAKEKLGNVLVVEILAAFNKLRTKGVADISMEGLEGAIKSFHECDQIEFFGPVAVPFKELDDRSSPDIPTLYEVELEAPFLAATKEFYSFESEEKISTKDITEYIRYAEKRLREEVQNAKSLFPIGSSLKIMTAVELQLVSVHTDRLQKDFKRLLEENMNVELEIVYRLLERIPDGIEPLATCFENFIVDQGQRMLAKIPSLLEQATAPVFSQPKRTFTILPQQKKVATLYVGSLAALSRYAKGQVTKYFNKDVRFLSRISGAFRSILTVQPPCTKKSPGVLMADQLDVLLQSEVDSDSAIDDSLECCNNDWHVASVQDVVSLVEYLEDKELFMAAYVQHLSERLLYRLSHNGHMETTLIHDLGVGNYQPSSDVLENLWLRGRLEFQVQVPTYVVWPLQYPMDPADPANKITSEMEAAIELYSNFYRKNWTNRRLYWLHNLSRVVLGHTNGKGKACEITATVPQAVLLQQFKDRDWNTATELMQRLGWAWNDFYPIIKPIISAGLLRWKIDEENAQDPGPATVIEYENNWAFQKSRLHLCRHSIRPDIDEEVSQDLPTPESTNTEMGIDSPLDSASIDLPDNKKFFAQAIVVKLLKANQTLSPVRLTQLVGEETSKPGPVSFIPTQSQLDLILEQLMEKQYVERDTRRDLYVYLP